MANLGTGVRLKHLCERELLWLQELSIDSKMNCPIFRSVSAFLKAKLSHMINPNDRSYTKDHEWALVDGNRVKIGITDFAQDALGDVVFVKLPDVGVAVTKGDSFSEVESTKSVSDIYSPLSGNIVQVNESLVSSPELVNSSPYEDGWIAIIEFGDESDLETMSSTDYDELTAH